MLPFVLSRLFVLRPFDMFTFSLPFRFHIIAFCGFVQLLARHALFFLFFLGMFVSLADSSCMTPRLSHGVFHTFHL